MTPPSAPGREAEGTLGTLSEEAVEQWAKELADGGYISLGWARLFVQRIAAAASSRERERIAEMAVARSLLSDMLRVRAERGGREGVAACRQAEAETLADLARAIRGEEGKRGE